MEIGLVGLPYAGKTTLFSLLTGQDIDTSFSAKREVNMGSANVPDDRIDFLTKLYKPKKVTRAQVQFKDIPGIPPGDKVALNMLLDRVRGADVLVQVVRSFSAKEVDQVAGEPKPLKELTDFYSELILADIGTAESRIASLKNNKKAPKDVGFQVSVLEKILSALENEEPAINVDLTEEEKSVVKGYNFLTDKPILLAINIDENQLEDGTYLEKEKIIDYAKNNSIPILEICSKVELEVNQLPEEERKEFMEDLGLKESGISRLARLTYGFLGLSSFFTVGEDEVRAWTIRTGANAKRAGASIHTDIERGFIRAEVFHFDDIIEHGNAVKVKEQGLFRLEGKEYIVKDGDIINFRFNV